MKEFIPDCRIAEQQIIWLQSLRPSYYEKTSATLINKIVPIPSEGYYERTNIANSQIDWWVSTNIEQVYRECQK
jgi:hypothetical protein